MRKEEKKENRRGKRPGTGELAELALLTALLVGGKEIMAGIPNVHPVALLLLYAVIRYGGKALYPAFAFIGVEVLLYGPGLWVIMYLYAWPLFVLAALPFRRTEDRLFWALFSGVFGLLFGALSSLPYIVLSGWKAAVAYWVAGIPFDLIHGAGNALISFFVLPVVSCRTGLWKKKTKKITNQPEGDEMHP